MASSKHHRTPSTSEPRDNSVLFALGELARLESDRVAQERDAERLRLEDERRRREQAEAERVLEARRLEEREAKTRAIAEAEARLRVEAEVTQDARMAALKAELARVQTEREVLHRSVLEAARPSSEGVQSGRGWPLAFGLSSLVAASLAGLLVFQAQVAPRVVEVERPAAPLTVHAAPEATAAPVEAAPAAVAITEAAPVAPESPRPRRPRGAQPVRAEPTATGTAARPHGDGLDFGGDGSDVLEGLEHIDTSMQPRSRRTR